ncbi:MULTISPECIES: aminoglycoside adenylyltransferase family protein [Streptomyces]|uniref:Aminoglycoside adenylyltransferase family protein n=2 Tax=Streptomyces TaxID=1883 RepID=A0ABU4KEQ5_9ACTN|nr:aminoglycoside adenylyltransferase family protein [Streptomyces roseolus]MDX2295810.1 aminoglycoside adenylyltransferase family protein [Streptomyces roseolus]
MSHAPGPPDAGAAQAHDVVRIVRETLGDEAVRAACAHGSAVLGGLRPTSDVDVLVVLTRHTTEAERRALTDGLLAVSGVRAYRGPARPVELSLVVHADVRPWRYPPVCEYLYGEWLRDDFEAGLTPAPAPCPDLAPLLTMARNGDVSLYGPRPSELFDPVPEADLRAAIVEGVPGLLADLDGDTRNVLLTLARIHTTLRTGRILSKDEAAALLLPRLPTEHRAPLEAARAQYLAGEYGSWADRLPAARAHAEYVAAGIKGAYSA